VRHDGIPLRRAGFIIEDGAEGFGVRADGILAADFKPQLRLKPIQEVVLVPSAHLN
jgi:hypothetical protein